MYGFTTIITILIQICHTFGSDNVYDINTKLTFCVSDFANKLYQTFQEEEGDILFSPTSLHALLSLLYLGAEGSIQQNLGEVLSLSKPKRTALLYQSFLQELKLPNTTLNLANRIFVAENINIIYQFKCVASEYYSTEIEGIDFSDSQTAVDRINDWISKATDKRISNVIAEDEIDKDTEIILVNTLYFKAKWLFTFEEPVKSDFYISESDTVSVDMLKLEENLDYRYSAELESSIIRIPYQDDIICLIIVLPKEIMGYKKLERKLVNVKLAALKRNLIRTKLTLHLPMFEIKKTNNMKEQLTELGLGELFEDVNLSGMTSESIKIENIVQKIRFKVDRNSSHAEVAPAMVVHKRRGPKKTFFNVNHPFLFYLELCREGYSHILLQGRVTTI